MVAQNITRFRTREEPFLKSRICLTPGRYFALSAYIYYHRPVRQIKKA